jgi:hypothetical protein
MLAAPGAVGYAPELDQRLPYDPDAAKGLLAAAGYPGGFMVRADYCGDGRGHTREGVQINVYDRLAIQVADPSPTMTFEAAWGADGAVCVHKVRVPEAVSLDTLVRACPERLAGKIGPDCTEKAALRSDDALIMNASGSPQTGP